MKDHLNTRRICSGNLPNTAPDWSNIAPEIDSVGKTQARDLASRITVILVHLIRLRASPARGPLTSFSHSSRIFEPEEQKSKVFLVIFLQKKNKNLHFLKKKKQKDFYCLAASPDVVTLAAGGRST
jgi:hypothetical protein